jgi:hypothetical protein
MVEASLPHRQQRLDQLPEFVVKQSVAIENLLV